MENSIQLSSARAVSPLAIDMKSLAQSIVASGLVSQAKDVNKAVVIIAQGQELGIGPMQSLSSIYIVNGKMTMSAQLMMALVFMRGAGEIEIVKSSDSEAVIRGKRSNSKHWHEEKFTSQDAEKAGLLKKDVWKSFPENMLKWRAISNLCKFVFPDVILGLYTPDEVEGSPEVGVSVVSEAAQPVAVYHAPELVDSVLFEVAMEKAAEAVQYLVAKGATVVGLDYKEIAYAATYASDAPMQKQFGKVSSSQDLKFKESTSLELISEKFGGMLEKAIKNGYNPVKLFLKDKEISEDEKPV